MQQNVSNNIYLQWQYCTTGYFVISSRSQKKPRFFSVKFALLVGHYHKVICFIWIWISHSIISSFKHTEIQEFPSRLQRQLFEDLLDKDVQRGRCINCFFSQLKKMNSLHYRFYSFSVKSCTINTTVVNNNILNTDFISSCIRWTGIKLFSLPIFYAIFLPPS